MEKSQSTKQGKLNVIKCDWIFFVGNHTERNKPRNKVSSSDK